MEMGACPVIPYDQLERKMVCMPDEPKDFMHFLSKFRFLDKIKWTEELVDTKMKYVCDEMNSENMAGAFLDFSVSKYRHIGWNLDEAIEFMLDSLDKYSNIPIIPILSIKYESPENAQLKIASIVDNEKINSRIGGIDFVGDTSKLNPQLQRRICRMWQGKLIRMHVGESEDAEQVRIAIDEIGVTNIAHGIKIVQDADILKMSADSGIVFDIAPTSNYVTGATPIGEPHPSKQMFDAGIMMTVGSDDPIQCRTTLLYEYDLLEKSGFNEDSLDVLADNSRRQLQSWINYSVGGK